MTSGRCSRRSPGTPDLRSSPVKNLGRGSAATTCSRALSAPTRSRSGRACSQSNPAKRGSRLEPAARSAIEVTISAPSAAANADASRARPAGSWRHRHPSTPALRGPACPVHPSTRTPTTTLRTSVRATAAAARAVRPPLVACGQSHARELGSRSQRAHEGAQTLGRRRRGIDVAPEVRDDLGRPPRVDQRVRRLVRLSSPTPARSQERPRCSRSSAAIRGSRHPRPARRPARRAPRARAPADTYAARAPHPARCPDPSPATAPRTTHPNARPNFRAARLAGDAPDPVIRQFYASAASQRRLTYGGPRGKLRRRPAVRAASHSIFAQPPQPGPGKNPIPRAVTEAGLGVLPLDWFPGERHAGQQERRRRRRNLLNRRARCAPDRARDRGPCGKRNSAGPLAV